MTDQNQTDDLVERVAIAIEETMFAAHEMPLDPELHRKYRDTARKAIAAVRQWDAQDQMIMKGGHMR